MGEAVPSGTAAMREFARRLRNRAPQEGNRRWSESLCIASPWASAFWRCSLMHRASPSRTGSQRRPDL